MGRSGSFCVLILAGLPGSFNLAGCSGKGEGQPSDSSMWVWGDGRDPAIRLRWLPVGPEEDWDSARAGLWWSLTAVGALPVDDQALQGLVEEGGGVTFTLDLDEIGHPNSDALVEPLSELRDSDEARHLGAVDLGRWLMRAVYEPWRYLAATGACRSLEGWRRRLPTSPTVFVITDSLLVETERAVLYDAEASTYSEIAFLTEEGEGSIEGGSFEVEQVEVLDVMDNGRDRYAAYDREGRLIPSAEIAGLPGRCGWCHEASLIGTRPQPEVGVGVTYEAFMADLQAQQEIIDAHRARQDTVAPLLDGARAHEWAERLVEGFLQPTAARVALEWGTSAAEVEAEASAAGLRWHTNLEYPEQAPVLWRADVDALLRARAPGFEPIQTLPSAREAPPDYAFAEPPLSWVEDCR